MCINATLYNSFLEILAKRQDAEEVTKHFAGMCISKWLEFLSDVEWESLCLGYLIIKYGYVPTGLLPGGTLKGLDIVGKTRSGCRIIGQCKKSPSIHNVEENFLDIYNNDERNGKALYFWFSYGGVEEEPSDLEIKIVDKEHIETWLGTEEGEKYLQVYR